MAVEKYWCTTAPNVPRLWSASSLSMLTECPRKFELRYVEGWKGKEENLDLKFGSFLHSCMRMYWTARWFGWTHNLAVNHAAHYAMILGDLLPPPVRDSQKAKHKKNLVRAIVWYFDEYGDEYKQIVKVKGELAVECNFNVLLDLINPDGEPYILQGYLDNLRTFVGQNTCWDYKTTGKSISDFYLMGFSPNVQSEIYTLGSRIYSEGNYTHFMADIIVIQVNGVQFHRHPVYLTPGRLEETVQDIKAWIRFAEGCAEKDYWPKSTNHCAFCEFHSTCDADPQLRINYLTSFFKEERRELIAAKKP
jgi:hypothetical protein